MPQDNLFESLNAICPSFMDKSITARFVSEYTQMPVPTAKHEDWRYYNPQNIFDAKYSSVAQIENLDSIRSKAIQKDSYKLFFANGTFLPVISDTENDFFEVALLSDLYKNNDERFFSYFNASQISSEGKFQALNICLANGVGIFVNQQPDKTIELIFVDDDKNQNFAQTHNIIYVGENVATNIIESHWGSLQNSLILNVGNEIFASEYSNINYTLLQNDELQGSQINTIKVLQSAHSRFCSTSLTFNGKLVRNNIYVEHIDEFCETELNGIFFSSKNQYFENLTKVRHNKPNCSTKELYRGIATDESTSVFAGEIAVAKNAQKTFATQSNKNILLSEKATIHSKPQLIIYADDVSCSHGSTIGQLDKDALFYCQARGIEYSQAVKLLLGAFFVDSMTEIHSEELHNLIDEIIKNKL